MTHDETEKPDLVDSRGNGPYATGGIDWPTLTLGDVDVTLARASDGVVLVQIDTREDAHETTRVYMNDAIATQWELN